MWKTPSTPPAARCERFPVGDVTLDDGDDPASAECSQVLARGRLVEDATPLAPPPTSSSTTCEPRIRSRR